VRVRAPITVNCGTISAETVAEEAQHHPARTPGAAYQRAARALVIRALLLGEAQRCATPAAPELIAPGKRETLDEARIRRLIEDNVAATQPDEAACRAFYRANKMRFRSPDIFDASHILFAAPTHDREALATATARAHVSIHELARSPDLFEALARERSDCESRANGGRLGQIVGGELVPEVETALRALEEGEVAAKPVISRFGAHVLRLDRRKLGEPLPFVLVRERIAGLLAEQDWRRNVAAYIDGLVRRARIEGIDMFPVPARKGAVA
jgi:peptidyl-prolyl cis-trans isomerase C